MGEGRGETEGGKELAYIHLWQGTAQEEFLNTCLPSTTELSPRERLLENDIIISSFGINCLGMLAVVPKE